MPRGKAINYGGQIFRPDLQDFNVFPELVAAVRADEKAPSPEAISAARERLRDPLEVYIGKHRGVDLVTATVRQTAKNRVRGCARRLARSPDDLNLRERLREEIATLDLNGKFELSRALARHDEATGQRWSYVWLQRFLYSTLPIVTGRDATLDAAAQFAAIKTPASSKDPFLRDLVHAASPVWKELTDRGVFHQREVGPKLRKRYPFAKWLDRIIDAATDGQLEVHEGSIVDALSALKIRSVARPPKS